MFSKVWNKIKDWSGWSTAGSIFTMRLEMIAGFAIAVLGAIDWSPLLGLGFETGINWKATVAIGGIMVTKALVQEIVRRWNADL